MFVRACNNRSGGFAMRLVTAVSLSIFSLMIGVAPGAAQISAPGAGQDPLEPYRYIRYDPAIGTAHYLGQRSSALQLEINGYTCVDPIAYKRLGAEINDLIRAMYANERDVKAAFDRDSKSLVGLSVGVSAGRNLGGGIDDPRDRVKADEAALDELKSGVSGLLAAYSRLKECPPETIYRTSGKPPVPGPRPVGGGMYERTPGMSPDGNSGVRFLVSVEGGFAGAKAAYDDLSIDPRSFIGGASVGVRVYQPYNMFFGVQVSALGTDLTKDAAPGFNVGLRWQAPIDVQVGKTFFQTGSTPVSVYGFVGPMWGGTRVSDMRTTEYFTLFGASAGVGVDVDLSRNWSVGAKVRAYTLGPSDRRSDGQHVEGGSLTGSLSYRF